MIAKKTPLFKIGDPGNITRYRPISVFPCFSKVLQRIMYNQLDKYLCEIILKAVCIPKISSSRPCYCPSVDQIYEIFENDYYTLRVFIDFSKVFHTIDHSMLLKN